MIKLRFSGITPLLFCALLILCGYVSAQQVSLGDSLFSKRAFWLAQYDSLRISTTDTSVQELKKLYGTAVELITFDNLLINTISMRDAERADSLTRELGLAKTELANSELRAVNMDNLILGAWGVSALALLLFIIFLILFLRQRHLYRKHFRLYQENESLLSEYRKRIQELQHQAENERIPQADQDPEKNYLREKMKRYQEEMEKMAVEKNSLEEELQRILNRLRET